MNVDNLKYIKNLFNSGELKVCKGDDKNYLLGIKDSYIKLNKNFYDLLVLINKSSEYEMKYLSQVNDVNEFNKLCEVLKRKKEKKDESYIYFKLKIIDKDIVNCISNYLKFLFHKKTFKIIFLFTILLNVYFYIYHFHITSINLDLRNLLLYYIIMVLIMVMHELGHASACKYYKLEPHDIGFGFYILFPVFFANVTNIWKLSKWKRIIVNIGGVYFQFLINIILIILSFYINSNLLTKIININFFVACYSLIPFLRNDGYWVYSDVFDLPNLATRSKFYFFSSLNGIFKNTSNKLNYPLFFYSIGNGIFLFFILFIYLKSIYLNISDILLSTEKFNIIQKGIYVLVISFFFIMFLKKQFISINKNIKFKWRRNINFQK